MVWLEGTSIGKNHFRPNRHIQHIGVCEIFVDNVQTVVHKTRIKLYLTVQNSRNIRNVNQRSIHRACPTCEKPKTY